MQFVFALVVRVLMIFFGSAGPSMNNPMLVTTWTIVNGGGEISADIVTVYWIAPILGAMTASIAYAAYAGIELVRGSDFFFHQDDAKKKGETPAKEEEQGKVKAGRATSVAPEKEERTKDRKDRKDRETAPAPTANAPSPKSRNRVDAKPGEKGGEGSGEVQWYNPTSWFEGKNKKKD